MGRLFVVATPIGNLEDITLRALRVLREVDLIFAEDTRETKKLLVHFGIKTPVAGVHARDEKRAAAVVVKALRGGGSVSLVSDAGTPAVSDPGALLVSEVRKILPEAEIVAVPGASALTAALSVAGLAASRFVFLGFLPHKKGRAAFFNEIASSKHTVVFYESPHRLIRTLKSLAVAVPDRPVVVLRELTKAFEECLTGFPADLLKKFSNHPETVRGEFVVMVGK